MNIAMHIMSIQHQFVLALDKDADLKKMLSQFLQICGVSLNATNGHIFLRQDKLNNPRYQLFDDLDITLKHSLSFPMKKKGILSSQDPQLQLIVQQFFEAQELIQELNDEDHVYHLFKISNFGVLVIEKQNGLSEATRNALIPVINKLASSSIASINHNALLVEIETRKKIKETMRFQATHDYLTGLYNRIEMQNRLADSMNQCVKKNKTGYLLLLNLVNFKSINDSIGFHVGDKVLRLVATRLKNATKDKAIVGKFNGQEFILLVDNLPPKRVLAEKIIDTIIMQIIDVIETPFIVSEGSFSLSCYIGFEVFTDNSKGVQNIIKNSNLAMHEAIKKSKSKYLAYNSLMSKQLNKHISYTKDITNALKSNAFELYYQPQFDHLNNIIGAEALLRWNNPQRGFESPAVFIPIAEESDLIIQIGQFVLVQACKDIIQLQRLNLPPTFKQISINVSAKQLAQLDFAEMFISTLSHWNVSPEHLKIEVTESIMMSNVERAIEHLLKLQEYGVESAIDDFGTGYSSLSYLKRFPSSLLKIDRAFVTNIHLDKSNYAIAKMIIELTKSLNMDVIAEGVETLEEFECLIELGCHQFQGYYLSRPLTFHKLMEDYTSE